MDLIEKIEGSPQAPVVVLFGGSPYRRDEVIKLLTQIGDLTVHGTLSEEEGMAKIEELDRKVDLVLIGGRYSDEQRERIQKWLTENIPGVVLSQPGVEYSYSNENIQQDIKQKLNTLK
jgi:vacuolar-type H+-ATPase subunit F/Vma7